jgi:FkbM family methyltransferase
MSGCSRSEERGRTMADAIEPERGASAVGGVNLRDLIVRRWLPFLLSRPQAQAVNRLLLGIALRGMGVDNHDMSQRDERRLLRRLRKTLPAEPIIFDVGANIGQYASLVLDELPAARLYSFEPNPHAFAKLTARVKSPHFRPANLALGAAPGASVMFDHADTRGSFHGSLVKGVIEAVHGDRAQEIPVEIATVDDVMAAEGLDHIDLLKIDVEGFEADVLRGAQRAIGARRIGVVQFEFNEMNVVSKHFLADFERLLPGYRLHRLLLNGALLDLSDTSYLKRELFGYQNIVALPR